MTAAQAAGFCHDCKRIGRAGALCAFHASAPTMAAALVKLERDVRAVQKLAIEALSRVVAQ